MANEKVKRDKLTDDELKLLYKKRDEAIDLVLHNKGADRGKIVVGMKWLYGLAKMSEPRVLIFDSPFACQVAANYLQEASLDSSDKELEEAINAKVQKLLKAKTITKLPWFDFSNIGLAADSGRLAFYDFFREIGVVSLDLFVKYKELLQAGVFDCITLAVTRNNVTTEVCIVTTPPVQVNLNSQNRLHSTNGGATVYRDGFKQFFLNGVPVPRSLVETPAEKLDPQILLKEKDVEIRREIVRKIGIERVCQKLNSKVVDKQGDYELLLLDLGDGRRRPYLKMKNPSIQTYHIEGVPVEIKTVKDALEWRNGRTDPPAILT